MAFENLKIQIAMLLEGVPDDSHDPHAIYQKVMQEINEMRAFGMPLPQDLTELEKALEERFAGTAPAPDDGKR